MNVKKIDILLVDDDAEDRYLVQRALKKSGHTVEFAVEMAATLAEGLEFLKNRRFDLILLDLGLPDSVSSETFERIHKACCNIPVVVLTGLADEEASVETIKKGASDYLVKGTDFFQDMLVRTVRYSIERSRIEQRRGESEERYRRITDAITDYIFTVRIENGQPFETIHSDVSAAVTGYTPEEFSADPNLWFNMVYPDDREAVLEQSSRCLSREDVEPLEHRIVRKDGAIRWVKSTLVRHFDPYGKLLAYDGLLQDINDRKQAEENLKQSKERAETAHAETEQMNKKLEATYRKLVKTSHQAGMAEVATDVLHNVGNILNSVNVSTTLIAEKVMNSEVGNLKKLADIIQSHTEDIGTFFTKDPQGKHIPAYLTEVSRFLTNEQAEIIDKLSSLTKNVEHIKEIVKMQQSYAKAAGVEIPTVLSELVDDAIQINNAGLQRHNIKVVCEHEEIEEVCIDKQRVLQVLVNLINNAKYATNNSDKDENLVTIRTHKHSDRLRITVTDNGVGMPTENLTKIFSHGFTTRKHGHGFGLHSGALAAKEMGGSLTAQSDGIGCGAAFTLELPFKPTGAQKCEA